MERGEFEAINTKLDIVRNPGSALRVCTSSERLANQFKINEMRGVGKLVTKTEMNAPKIGKSVTKKPKSWENRRRCKIGEEDRDG